MPTERIRYVNTQSLAGGDGTTSSTAGVHRAYRNLNTCISSEAADLVSADVILRILCDGLDDINVTAITVGQGWVVDSEHYIQIEANTASKTKGIYDGDVYELKNNTTGPMLTISVPYTRLKYLQVYNSRPTSAEAGGEIVTVTAPGVVLEGCIFRSWYEWLAYHPVVIAPNPSFGLSDPVVICNCVFVYSRHGIYLNCYEGQTICCYNNTFLGMNGRSGYDILSIRYGIYGGVNPSGDIYIYNNIMNNDNSCLVYDEEGESTNLRIHYGGNYTTDNSALEGADNRNKTFTFSQYWHGHLKSSDTSGALRGGVNLWNDPFYPVRNDVDEEVRYEEDGLWDAGYDQVSRPEDITAAFRLLPNTVALEATSINNYGSTTDPSSSLDNAVVGPRNRLWFSTLADPGGLAYYFDSSHFNHVVIARADYLDKLTISGATVNIVQYEGSWSTKLSYAAGELPLVGLNGQDYVEQLTIENITRAGVTVTPATPGRTKLSKLFLSRSFDFGSEPDLGARWVQLPRTDRKEKPLNGDIEYDVEAEITLSWHHVSQAKIEQFKNLEKLLEWDLFLYDSENYLWNHTLEHVILSNYQITQENEDLFEVNLTFFRLKQY